MKRGAARRVDGAPSARIPRSWRKLDSRRWLSSDGRLIFRQVYRLLSGGMTVTFTLYRTDRMHPTNELGTYYKISEAKEVE